MRKNTVFILISFVSLLTGGGCGFRIVQTNPLAQIKLNKMRLYDPGNCAFTVDTSIDPNSTDPNSTRRRISWPDYTIEPNEPVTVRYRFFEYAFGRFPMLDAKLSSGDSIILEVDTGCMLPLFIGDSIIQNRRLPIYPFKNEIGAFGACDLPDLTVGGLTFRNQPCFFLSQHLEFHVTGIPLWKQNIFLLGLPTLQQFKYILFDDPNREVTFSKAHSFCPANPEQWTFYPMDIKTDPNYLGTRISTMIPMAGQETEIGFDSGGGNLVLRESVFENMRSRLEIRSERNGTFLAIQHGPLDCRKVQVRNLDIGNRRLKQCEIVVLPDDTEYLIRSEMGYLSLKEFRDTAVALDFHKNRIWVRN